MPKVEPNRSLTQRGFVTFDEFKDGYQNNVRVQESSNVEGGIWIFCSKDQPVFDDKGCEMEPSPHLMNKEQVNRLIESLRTARREVFGS